MACCSTSAWGGTFSRSTRSSRRRRASSERTRSTARLWAWRSRNDRSAPAVGVVAVGLVPEAEEDLLGDLLGHGPVGEDAPHQAVDAVAVTAVGLGQRLLVATADGVDEAGIVELVGQRIHVPRQLANLSTGVRGVDRRGG